MEDLNSMFAPRKIFDKTTGKGCDIEVDSDNYVNNIQPTLAKYNWFISPHVEASLRPYIAKNINQQADPESFLNKVFVYFFSVNNFFNLDFLVGHWYCYSMVGDRFPILEECVNVLKDSICNKSNIKNPHYVIIPTLIAQIEGLKGFIIEQHKRKNMNNDIKDSKRSSEKKNVSELAEKIYSDSIEAEFSFIYTWLTKESTVATDLLFDVLFQTAQPMDKMEKLRPPFSRHKIMHGQFLEYGNMENTIRLFLLIDFLAELNYEMNKSKP